MARPQPGTLVDTRTTATATARATARAGNRPAGASAGHERPGRSRWVLLAAGLLVVAQLALRAWLLDERGFYADDLMYGSEAVAKPLLSGEYLVEDRDGHFMPAALLLHGGLYRLFPLQWEPFAVALLVLQLCAGLAVLRLLRVLLGDRPALLVPLAVYLFCPLSLGPFTWWAAAMNSVPLQIGLAWVLADAVLLVRTRRLRYAVTGTAALALTLLFYERAVLVPFLAFGVAALVLYGRGVHRPLRRTWQRGRALWCGALVVLAGWAAVFVAVVPPSSAGSATPAQVAELTRVAARSLAPALLGGPWRWADVSGPPMAAPPTWAAPAAAVALVTVVAWTAVRRRGGGAVWVLTAGYFLVGTLVVGIGRGSMEFAALLPLTYRYFAAEAVLAALVPALLLLLPVRGPTVAGPRAARAGSALAVLLLLGFVAGSSWSTVTFRQAWASEPTPAYLAAARASLADAGDEPLLDWDVPETILWSHWAPWNRASLMFGPLEDRPAFGAVTSVLRAMDDDGVLRPAAVVPGVLVGEGPVPGCGWPVGSGTPTAVALTAPAPAGEWTAELRYVADRDGTVEVALGQGAPVLAPVRAGSGTVYLRLPGEGPSLRLTTQAPGPELCVSAGVVGEVVVR